MIHIRHYEENDESTAISRVLSSAQEYSQHPKQAVKYITKMIPHCWYHTTVKRGQFQNESHYRVDSLSKSQVTKFSPFWAGLIFQKEESNTDYLLLEWKKQEFALNYNSAAFIV